MDYETLRGNLNDALAELEHLSIREDLIEINEALRCTAGGHGDVYRATLREPDSVSSRVVAVKELRAVGDDVTRIRLAIHLARELQVWARLKHPNVLELIGYCLNPQMITARFISPFMANGNIVEYLENDSQPVSDDLRLKLLRDSLEGLLYLHSLNPPICHADIKPENVLVTDMVEAVLCDFGLARLTEEQPSGLTTTKTIKGSTRYMSPELLEEDAVHTLSSDIWAYGCLVLKVMTGSLPYARTRSEHQVISALIKYQPPAELVDSGLRDDGLKTLLAKCWNKDPSARPSASKCQLYLPIPGGSEAQLPGTRVSLSSAAQLVANSNFPQPRPSTAVDSPFGSEEPWDTLSGVDSTLGTSGNVRQHGPVLHLFPTLRVDEESLAKSAWNPTSLGNDPTFGTSGGARQESVFAQVLEPLEPGYPLLSGKDIHGTSSRGVSTVKSIVKPFTCPICGLNFTERDGLTIHRTVHDSTQWYYCKGCDKRFKRPENLRRHQNRSKKCGKDQPGPPSLPRVRDGPI